MDPLKISSDRLELRALVSADVEAVHTVCQDPEIQRWVPIPSPYERQHAEYFVEQVVPEGWRTDTVYTFGVFPRGGGALIGAANLQPRTEAWEIGYWTAAEHRGRGYTAETVGALARWAFAQGVDRLEWRAEKGNEASRAVARKAGFVWEGTLRAALLSRGTLRDLWIGSLLPSDLGLESAHAYLPAQRASA
ncbi:GNAT family N-acetyltransferase [Streptomyces sp. NRRL F-5126]|uniref:GNAT family N-acetyltransferase n=1 Tax=Streptomyces sp. NRRL F-5126 TaxID=1463857 RepID=UPI0004C5BAF9|nr:GNAT family N-acetyltransferase [Streptomyces sp. NRRL F-5126]